MRIIWIEDSQVLKHTLDVICEKHNAKAIHIYDVEEFKVNHLAKLSDDDIILLDILFDREGARDKNGHGYKVLQYLREAGKINIPVVILTVVENEDVLKKVEQYKNVIKIIRKPATSDEIEEALLESLNKQKNSKG